MMKTEKIIKGIECCTNLSGCEECPYDSLLVPECYEKCQCDALELLKKQTWRKFNFREPNADEKKYHPEWVKVLISGPDDGDEILVSNGRYVWKDEFRVDYTCYLESDADLEECWWMPLPEPPTQEAQRDYEAASDIRDYCERYEQTYNSDDGSM